MRLHSCILPKLFEQCFSFTLTKNFRLLTPSKQDSTLSLFKTNPKHPPARRRLPPPNKHRWSISANPSFFPPHFFQDGPNPGPPLEISTVIPPSAPCRRPSQPTVNHDPPPNKIKTDFATAIANQFVRAGHAVGTCCCIYERASGARGRDTRLHCT